MNHLTTDELIRFISIKTLNDETRALTARVNTHILDCDECLKKVRELQDIMDSEDEAEDELDITLWENESDKFEKSTGVMRPEY